MEDILDLQLFAEGAGGTAAGGGSAAAESQAPIAPQQKRDRAAQARSGDANVSGELAGGPAAASGMPRPTDAQEERNRAAQVRSGDTNASGELAGGDGASGMPRPTGAPEERYRAAQGTNDNAPAASELAGGDGASGMPRPTGAQEERNRAAQGTNDNTPASSELAGGPAAARMSAALQEHFRHLEGEAEQMREVFPGFDLRQELRDPRFAALTAPGMGVSVEDAYYALHRRELQAASMQVAAQRASQKLASSIQSAARRPVENGSGSSSPAGFSLRHMSREQREDLRQRIYTAAALGTKIYP